LKALYRMQTLPVTLGDP